MTRAPLGIILFALILAAAATGFDREAGASLRAGKFFGASVSASVYEEPAGFEWIYFEPRYSLSLTAGMREYTDGFGWYKNALFTAGAGRLGFAGGIAELGIAAGYHLSALEGGYSFSDFVFGIRLCGNLTPAAKRRYLVYDAYFLSGPNFEVAGGEIRAFPLENIYLGGGIIYDGELDAWGEPLPFQDDESWPDRWESGVNYYISAGVALEL